MTLAGMSTLGGFLSRLVLFQGLYSTFSLFPFFRLCFRFRRWLI